MRTRSILSLAGLLAALLGAPAAWSQSASTVRLAWNKTWDVLPLIIAEKNGYWKSRGVEVKYV